MFDIWKASSHIAEEVYEKDNYLVEENSSGGGVHGSILLLKCSMVS